MFPHLGVSGPEHGLDSGAARALSRDPPHDRAQHAPPGRRIFAPAPGVERLASPAVAPANPGGLASLEADIKSLRRTALDAELVAHAKTREQMKRPRHLGERADLLHAGSRHLEEVLDQRLGGPPKRRLPRPLDSSQGGLPELPPEGDDESRRGPEHNSPTEAHATAELHKRGRESDERGPHATQSPKRGEIREGPSALPAESGPRANPQASSKNAPRPEVREDRGTRRDRLHSTERTIAGPKEACQARRVESWLGEHEEEARASPPEIRDAVQSEMDLLERITLDPAIRHGRPTLRGLRYTVEMVLELLSSGMTSEEILADYEDLEHQDIMAALAYAAKLTRVKRIDPTTA